MFKPDASAEIIPFPTQKPPYETFVVVTGSHGFIGKHLVRKLIALGYNTMLFDIKQRPEQDICSGEFPKADWCFHLAALTDAQCGDYAAMRAINYYGTRRVLETYQDKTIYTSTSAIYYPGTPYADSKIEAERTAREHWARTVRLCNIFGPGGHGVIDHFTRSDVLRIRGRGTQLRTYAHVNHAVIALIRQMKQPPGNLHILPGAHLTVNEIAYTFFAGKPREYVPQNVLDLEHAPQVYA